MIRVLGWLVLLGRSVSRPTSIVQARAGDMRMPSLSSQQLGRA